MNIIMRTTLLTTMGFIILIGFLAIGFFIFPIGITLCAALGLVYGCRNSDKLFINWSTAALAIGIALIIYTLCLINSM